MAIYEPEPIVGPDIERTIEQISREHRRVSDALFTVDDYEASRFIDKPLEGMLRFFDPVIYAPPPGVKGLYFYQDGEWKYVGPLPDTLPAEVWTTIGHGFLTLVQRDIVPAFNAIVPGSTAQAFSVDVNGVLTSLVRMACSINLACVFNVDINANNQDINWAVFFSDTAAVLLPPIGEFASSTRIVNFDQSSASAGSALFDVDDTIQFHSQILSRTGVTPTVDLTLFVLQFSDIEIIP